MFLLYQYASGKYTRLMDNENYLSWVNQYGEKVKRAVKILVVIYTLAQIILLLGD